MADHEVEIIRVALVPLLQEQPPRWWTAYSLWHRIEGTDPDLARRIVDRYGTAVGQGGGDHTGRAHGIATILGAERTPHVETDYLETVGLSIGDVPFSRNPRGTAIFHWRD